MIVTAPKPLGEITEKDKSIALQLVSAAQS